MQHLSNGQMEKYIIGTDMKFNCFCKKSLYNSEVIANRCNYIA